MALDVHCRTSDLAVVTGSGKVSRRWHGRTAIPDLVEAIASTPGPRHLAIEEGPLADWLFRNLSEHVDRLVVCDPRRNSLIAKGSDKDDPIDAEKLAQLLRGGYLKEVHHPESFDRMVFKHHVALYHDRVRHRVAEANRIIGFLRRYGVVVRERAFAEPRYRRELVSRLPENKGVRADVDCLWGGYDMATHQQERLRRQVIRWARREAQIRRFEALPGISWIRASTFFVYVDTPWRFKGKSALWRYMGIGLERRHSGGGPERMGVSAAANRPLKCMILGAARSAIAQGDNPFADQYRRWCDAGLSPRLARRNVARSLAATLWGMWKTGSVYRPEWVGVPAASSAMTLSEKGR
jgi:transposase